MERVTATTTLPTGLEVTDLKAWARYSHTSEDAVFELALRAAIEGYERRTGIAIWPISTWTDDSTCLNGYRFLRVPVLTLDSVVAHHVDGTTTALDKTQLVLSYIGRRTEIRVPSDVTLPSDVAFWRIGWTVQPKALFQDVREMILMLATTLFENRQSMTPTQMHEHAYGFFAQVRSLQLEEI